MNGGREGGCLRAGDVSWARATEGDRKGMIVARGGVRDMERWRNGKVVKTYLVEGRWWVGMSK